MNTDKTTIDISNESLQDVLNRLPKFGGRKEGYNYTTIKEYALAHANCAANWQKEKDKAIIDKLFDQLKYMISESEDNGYGGYKFVESSIKLLNELQTK